MATIIEFSTRKAAERIAVARPKSKAEIVIFPGVRYERAPATPPEKPAAPGGRERDTLAITD